MENEKKLQKVIGKLISEEWIATELYRSLVIACTDEARETIAKMFNDNANDEYLDHFTKLANFAIANGIEIPCRFEEYAKRADERAVKLMKFKRGGDAQYCIGVAVESEELAIESYAEVLNDENVPQVFKALILEMYYDEVEHMNNLKTLLLACNVGAYLKC
jgi:ferritin-like protein